MDLALAGRFLAASLVVAAVLTGFAFVARRASRAAGGGPSRRLVELVETAYLPGSAALHVVRIVDRYYALGHGGSALAPICEIAASDVAARRARAAFAPAPAWWPRCRPGARR